MSSNEVVGIELSGSIEKLRQEFAQIPKVADQSLKAAVAAASKELRQLERSVVANGKAAKNASSGVDSLGNAAGKTGQSAAKLRGALSALSPTIGESMGGVNDLADAIEVAAESGAALGISSGVLGVAMLAVAEVAVAGYVAWRIYSEDATRAAAVSADLAAAQVALKPILDDTRDTSIDLRVAMGEITEEAGKMEHASIKAFAALQTATADAKKKMGELRVEQGGVWTQMVDMAEGIVPAWTPMGMVIDGLTTSSSEYQIEIDALNGTVVTAIEKTRENRAIHEKLIETEAKGKRSKAGLTAATKEQEEAIKALNDAMEHEAALGEKNRATYTDAIAKMNELEEADKKSLLTKAEKMEVDHKAALQELDDLRAQALAVAETVGARETIEQEYRAASKAENAAYYAEIKAYDDDLTQTIEENAAKAAEAHKAYQESVAKSAVNTAVSVADSVGSIAQTMMDSYSNTNDQLTSELEDSNSHLTKQQKAELTKRIADNKKHAMEAFTVWKAAAIASATITGIVSVINAVNDGLAIGGPAGLIVGAAAGVAQGIAVAAQIAAIASTPAPSFHTGLAPDEYGATLKAGEGVLSTQGVAAMGGSEAVRSANNGQAMGGQITIINQHKHKIFDVQVRENLRAGGQLAALAGATRTWHRSR